MNTKSKAVVGLSNLMPEGKVIKAQSVLDTMKLSGNFADANMPIKYAVLQTYITNLHNSVITASTGSASDVSAMHEHEKILVMAFNMVKAHVEFVSNVHTNADTFILSSGMALGAKTGAGAVTDLTLTATTSGTVVINVPRKAGEKAYYFEYALDTAPTDWKPVGYTTITKYTLSNQTPATKLW
ncbi:MAG: hypothetical protein ABL940_11905, partial [Bacteroidia bacterium]